MAKGLKQKKLILWFILCVQIGFIAYANFFLQGKNIDSDMARLYVHAIEIWKNRSYYIPGWSYVTTAEWDCSLLFAVPFYGITGNVYVAFACANMIFVAIWIWTIFSLFGGKDKIYPLVALNLILIPYGVGMLSYFNMLFFNGGQYVVKVLLPLMLTAVLLGVHDENKWKWHQYVFSILYLILLSISTASSGMYVFLCGVFPCLFAYFLYALLQKKRISIWYWICILSNILAIGVGYYLNAKYQVGSKGNSMTFCIVPNQMQENVEACFWGFFELFEGVTYYYTEIMSGEGIMVLVRMLFTAVLLVCGVRTISKVLKGKETNLFCVMLISVFVVNTIILCICNDLRRSNGLFEFRYHLVGVIPLMILTAKWLVDCYKNGSKQIKQLLLTSCAIVFLLLFVDSCKEITARDSSRSEFRNICNYANAYDVDKVYFDDYEGAEICRLFDMDTEYHYFISDGATYAYTHVFDYYEAYKNQSVDFRNSLLVIYSMEEKETLEMLGWKFSFVAQEGAYRVYVPIEM